MLDPALGQFARTVPARSSQESVDHLPANVLDAATQGVSLGFSALFRHEPHRIPFTAYVPLKTDKEVLGVLALTLSAGASIEQDDKQLVNSIVNHLSIALQRDRLLKEQARAQALVEADKLKTALLSMVSHDFRSPLTSIKTSVDTLLEGEKPIDAETQRALLKAIEQETDRLNRMVGNILDMSRLEAGSWRPKREETSVTELVGWTLETFEPRDNDRIKVEFPQMLQMCGLMLCRLVKFFITCWKTP